MSADLAMILLPIAVLAVGFAVLGIAYAGSKATPFQQSDLVPAGGVETPPLNIEMRVERVEVRTERTDPPDEAYTAYHHKPLPPKKHSTRMAVPARRQPVKNT